MAEETTQTGSILGDYYKRISSETGLPEKTIEDVNPNSIRGEAFLRTKDPGYLTDPPKGTPNPEFDPLRGAAATIDLTNAYPEPLSNYTDYGVPLSPFADLNEERAQRQSTGQKWLYGITKAGITLGTAFAENTVGLLAGLGNLAFGENHSFTDNPFGRAMDNINEAARESMPNYYTKAENEAGLLGDGFGTGVLSANFWADKVAGGAAYTVASIASMFVGTGEAALAAKLAGAGKYGKLTGVLNKLNKVDELVDATGAAVRSNKSAAYQAAKLVSTGGDAADVVAQTGRLSKVANMKVGARNFTIATQMSLAEASMESRESKNRFIDERLAEWEQTTGLDRNQIDSETMAAIEASASAAGNLTFGINLPILVASNAIMFANMFKSGKPLAEAVSGKVTRDATGKYIEQAAGTGFGKAFETSNRMFGKTVSGIVTEGFQEGTQFLGSELSRRYYADKYQDGVGDMVAAFNYGLAQTVGSKEGLENIFIGAIIGGGMGTISRMFGADKKFQDEKDANTQKLLTLLNNGGLTKALENLDFTEQTKHTVNLLNEVTKKGDNLLADRLRSRLILQVTNQFRKLGGLDAAFEQLEDMQSFTEQEFKERWGYDTTRSLKDQTGKTQMELIQDVKTKMENFTKVSENIESIMAERQIPQQVIPRVIDSLFQTEEIKNARVLQDKVFSTYANMLLNRVIDIDAIDESISERYEKLVQLVPGLGALSKEDFEFGVKVGEFTFKDGKVELDSEITREGEGSKNKNEKRVKKQEEIRETINNFLAVGRVDLAEQAAKVLNELNLLMSDRTVVNTALKRMNASPNEIATILEEELLEQYRESINAEIATANTVINNAQSTTDIDSAITTMGNLPDNIQTRLKQRWLELWNEETKLVADYLSMKEDDFNSINPDSLPPLNKAAYERARSRKEVSAREQKEIEEQKAKDQSLPTSEDNPSEVNGHTVSYDTVLDDAEMQAFGDITFKAVKGWSNNLTWYGGIFLEIDGKEYANMEEDSLDALIFDYATGEVVGITLTDMTTGNKVTWSMQEGENLSANQQKENARAKALIYFTMTKAASVVPLTSTEQVDQIKEDLKTEQQVLTEEFEEMTGEKLTPSKEELNQYALENIEKTKGMSDAQLRVQVEELKRLIEDISNQIDSFIKLGEFEFGDRKSAEQYFAGDLKDLRAINKRLKNYLSNKTNALRGRKTVAKKAVIGEQNVNDEKTEADSLTPEDIDYLINNTQDEINRLNEDLAKLRNRLDNYELIQGSVKSANSLAKLRKDVEVLEAKIKKRENQIFKLNETRESQKRTQDGDTTERPGQTPQGERPEAADLPTAEAPQTEGISITSVNPVEVATVIEQAAEVIETTPPPPGAGQPIAPVIPQATGEEVMLAPEYLDITIAKTVTPGTLEFEDRTRQTETINGEKTDIVPEYDALASSDVIPSNPNIQVRFVVREDTDYWKEETARQNFQTQEEYDAWMMNEGWKRVPIYVTTVVNGQEILLPLVNAARGDGKNASRQLIYKLYKSGLTPVAKAEKLFNNNDIRFKNENGVRTFYDLKTLFSGTQEEVLNKIRESIVYVGMTDEKLTWKVNKIEPIKEVAWGEGVLGQIGIVLKDPNGGNKIVTLSTRNLRDVPSAIEAAMKSLKSEELGLNNFTKIVGTNFIELLEDTNLDDTLIQDQDIKKEIAELTANNEREKYILVEALGNTGVNLFTYFSKSVGKFVRLNEAELRLALSGNPTFKVQFIDYQMTDEGVRAVTVISPEDSSNRATLAANIEKEIREVVSKKKFQVDINSIKSDMYGFSISLNGQDEVEFPSYIEYLMSDDALGTPRQEGINGKGTSAILSTDIEVGENNTIYFDTGLKFSQLGTAENGPLSIQESIGTLMPGKKGDATPSAPTTDTKADINNLIDKRTIENELTSGNYSFYPTEEAADKNEGIVITKDNINQAIEADKKLGDVIYNNKSNLITGIPSPLIYIEVSPGINIEFLGAKDLENFINDPTENPKEREIAKEKYNAELAALGQPATQTTPEVKTPSVSLDINVQPLENSTADALKGTEDVMNSIYGDIFGVSTPAPKVTPTPVSKPTPSASKIFMTPEEAGLSEEDLIGNLYEDYTEDPNAPAEAEDLAQKCQTYTPNK
jgi:hypothetical protein